MSLFGYDRRDVSLLRNFFFMGLRDRFLGSGLGIVWSVANPMLMLGLFTFVFGFVYKSRLPGAETSISYVIWLISGYGPWLATTEALTTATVSVSGNAGLIKNLSFKTEILPASYTLLGFIPLGVALVFTIVLLSIEGRMPEWSWLTIIPVVVLQLTLIVGMSFMLSAVNVFVRDVSMVLPNILMIVLFASPIFYAIDNFPAKLRPLMALNPFYIISEGYRQPLVYHSTLALWQFAYLTIFSLAVAVIGLKVFRRLKPHFHAYI